MPDLFFNKVAGLRPATLLKKRLWHRCFPVNFAKFLRTPILQNTSGGYLYRSPSQASDEFVDFCTDLNFFLLNINDLNPACSVITGDFNSRSPQWWALDKENKERREISFLTSSAGYSQLINQPTHIAKKSSSYFHI